MLGRLYLVLAAGVLSSVAASAQFTISPATLPAGKQAAYYSQQFSTNPSTQVFWYVSAGSLPNGLFLDSGGLLSGFPSQIGSYNFTVAAQGFSSNVPVTQAYTLAIAKNLTITTTSTPLGVIGATYNAPLAATAVGAEAFTVTWAQSGGSLPNGLTIDSGGAVMGTPAASGTFTVIVTATTLINDIVLTDTASIIVPIDPPLGVATASLPGGTQAIPYSQTLAAIGGGARNYAWSLGSGTLPPGLTLSGSGTISGVPATIGNFSFTVFVALGETIASRTLSINIAKNLRITTTSIPAGTYKTPYSALLAATGGAQPYSWTVSGGALPSGVTLSNTGVLSGTPNGSGSFNFTASVNSTLNSVPLTDSVPLTLHVAVPALTITTNSLPNGVPGISYSASLSATGGIPPLGWSLQGGALPNGLTLTSNGAITGRPTTEGTFTFTVQVSDDGFQSDSRRLTIVVAYPPITVTASLPGGTAGVPYSGSIQASGGNNNYSFSVASGSLPPGLSIGSGGAVSGNPTTAGTFSFAVQVNDTSGKSATGSFSITIRPPALSITPSSLPDGTVGVAYSASLGAVGGTAPYTFGATGLPPGLSIDSAGRITGTPTSRGNFSISATVTDRGGVTASGTVTVTINLPVLTISGTPPAGFVGVAVNGSLTVSGGAPPYVCSVSEGSLPAGVNLNTGCVFGGTPTAVGTSRFTVSASDRNGATGSQSFTMTVTNPPLVITTESLPNGTVGAAYSQTLAATGGAGTLTWSGGGGLPAGVALDAGGTVAGTSLTAGTFTFTATVQDRAGTTASKTLSVTFVLPPVPPGSFPGLTDTAQPATQPVVQFRLSAPYPVAITGTLTLTFRGDDGSDDPAVQFSTGGRTLPFSIAANSTTPVFSVPNVALATGTTAGLITITASFRAGNQDITPNPPPTQQIRIGASPPVITEVRATRSGNTITVTVTGFATSKQMTSAAFTFSPAAGASFQTTALTVQVDPAFSSYFSGASSAGFGSQFRLTQTFTVSGDSNAIASVSVVLTNSRGSSSPVSATIQ